VLARGLDLAPGGCFYGIRTSSWQGGIVIAIIYKIRARPGSAFMRLRVCECGVCTKMPRAESLITPPKEIAGGWERDGERHGC